MYRIRRFTFSRIDMTAIAFRPDGSMARLEATWAWAPQLTWYDREREQWLGDEEWEWEW